MNVTHQEQFVVTLVPERAAVFARWARWRKETPSELFLNLLAIGTVVLAQSELHGDDPEQTVPPHDEAEVGFLIETLGDSLDLWQMHQRVDP